MSELFWIFLVVLVVLKLCVCCVRCIAPINEPSIRNTRNPASSVVIPMPPSSNGERDILFISQDGMLELVARLQSSQTAEVQESLDQTTPQNVIYDGPCDQPPSYDSLSFPK